MSTRYDRDDLAVIPGVGISLADFAKSIERDVMIQLRVGMPGEVVAWRKPVSAGNKSKPALVDVQPHFKFTLSIDTPEEVTDAERANGWETFVQDGGWVKQRALPVIRNVRVHYVGSAGLRGRGPLKAGEVGWLSFADRSLDKWTQTGGPVDPGFSQYHDLTDAIFVPGLRYGKIEVAIDDTKHVLGPDDGSAALEFDDVKAPDLPNVMLRTSGEELTLDAAASIKVGLGAVLAAMRQTDPVNPGNSMIAWALAVETAINTLALPAPPIFTPANSFVTTVATANSGNFGTCGTGSALVSIE